MITKETIGQAFGIIAVIITFISYQVKTQRSVLILQSFGILCLSINYALLGATSGLVLGGFNVIINVSYIFKNTKLLSTPAIPYVFAAISLILGALSWEAYYSVFYIVGISVNTVFRSKAPQTLRKSILVTSTLILIYNIYVFSIGGICNEIVAIVSSIIGIIRFRKRTV